MTVSTTTNKVAYIGNGIATSFAIPFPFLEQEHLKVYQLSNNELSERTDWTISNENMVFETAPAENAQIVIMREVPLTQETDYRENEVLPAETLERNFDKLTMQVQQLKEQADRAVTVDIFDDTDTDAASLIPSIRRAVSDCAEYASTATNKAQAAITQAGYAASSAQAAALSEQNAANLLANKADKDVYATKSQRGLAQWSNSFSATAENRPAVVVESWHSGANWYRVWSDGLIEQGGFIGPGAANTFIYITFPKPFESQIYDIQRTIFNGVSGASAFYDSVGISTYSLTGMYVSQLTSAFHNGSWWYVCGY